MAVTIDPSRPSRGDELQHHRLGLDLPAGWWPTTPRLKGWEAAGFGMVQITIAGRELLLDHGLLEAHAAALRANLRLTGMGLILHAPGDLIVGARRDDALLGGALRYAEVAGAEMLVLHGGRVDGAERSLRRLARRAGDTGVRVAVENAAPRYPGEQCASHDPRVVGDLVRRMGCEEVGMCLDIGHAYIAADRLGRDLAELIEPLLDDVVLFDLHDNFGARSGAQRAGGIEPMRLDLHLAPGAGSVPWATIAPLLAPHPAPLVLEVHPGQRPVPGTLAVVVRELLGLRRSLQSEPSRSSRATT
jgi:sugar phosphate isomerase/epimerase